ncbi:ABC transporter permease [Zavarzinia aquatilis]|uniref:ABC transporter permease n=1 Tax=Zavarzinia aquatilis TaxID=2211142 RepID=A0A317DZU3_9PROT|nr:ABC transporter permease [Zavarzinia aquatilis]PWR20337.1 ABC transporter permease [Zavarzinia aquatilis]
MAGRALTPLTLRRLKRFRANRRGFWSLWIFLSLFGLSLFAEFIANDRPLYIQMEGKSYFPTLVDYTETELGGDFETSADYTAPFLRELFAEKGATVIWPLIPFSWDTVVREVAPYPAPPSALNWLGTDNDGHDIAATLIYGFRISILFGLALTVASSIVGVLAGLAQGFLGGLTDLLMQRFIEIWSGMPVLYLLIILSAVIEPSFFWLLGIMLLFSWMELVGLVRAEALRARNFDYVRAARALGLTNIRIMLRHVLPNTLVATVTMLPFVMNGSIATLTSLDYLRFGLQQSAPSLGKLLSQAKDLAVQAPWIPLSAFCTVALLLSLLVFIGEATRDAFDPRRGP